MIHGLVVLKIMVITKLESFFVPKVKALEKWIGFEAELNYLWVLRVVSFHTFAVYWCYNYALPVKWLSLVYMHIMYTLSGFGITAGAHRYWTHRSYKASTPFRILLMLCYACGGQITLYRWIHVHRIHHKYSDTAADPHDRNRGIFFSHIGWLMMKYKPGVLEKYDKIDMTDIDKDLVVQFQTKYVVALNIIMCFVIPTLISIFVIGEPWRVAIAWECFIRQLIMHHFSFTVNSFAHTTSETGSRPYNKSIIPVDHGFVALLSAGEGWHNYHHAFPFDYRASEWLHAVDVTTILLDAAEKVGMVSDKKIASKEMIKNYIERESMKATNNKLPPNVLVK